MHLDITKKSTQKWIMISYISNWTSSHCLFKSPAYYKKEYDFILFLCEVRLGDGFKKTEPSLWKWGT